MLKQCVFEVTEYRTTTQGELHTSKNCFPMSLRIVLYRIKRLSHLFISKSGYMEIENFILFLIMVVLGVQSKSSCMLCTDATTVLLTSNQFYNLK